MPPDPTKAWHDEEGTTLGFFNRQGSVPPATSWGYQPPPGAVVAGWRCPNWDCSQTSYEPPRRWPAHCPECGGNVDPTFAEPWQHEAEQYEFAGRIDQFPEGDGVRDIYEDKLAVWYVDDALLSGDSEELERAVSDIDHHVEGRRSDGGYFIEGNIRFPVVWAALEAQQADLAASQLQLWYDNVDATDVENDNERRTNCRQLAAMMIRFLEDPGTRGVHTSSIRRNLDELMPLIADVATADIEQGYRRLVGR